MTTRNWRMGGIAFAAIAMACAYDPHPNDGEQECYGPQKKCPDGYVCQFDRMCWTIGHSPAVSPGTGGIITIGVGGTPSVGSTIGSGGIVGYGGSQITGSVIGYGGVAGHGFRSPLTAGPSLSRPPSSNSASR